MTAEEYKADQQKKYQLLKLVTPTLMDTILLKSLQEETNMLFMR